MADEEPVDVPQTASPLHPALQAFQDAFPSDDAKEWAQNVATQVQNFSTQKQVADLAQQDANDFVNNLAGFKNGLLGMVQKDPSTAPLALGLVEPTIQAQFSNHPGLSPEELADHAEVVTSHLQSEIARQAVQSFAVRDDKAAFAAIDRYKEHLSDSDVSTLAPFIHVMAQARDTDHQAQLQEVARRGQETSDLRANAWLGALSDPQTGEVRFPNNWTVNLMQDAKVAPDAKAALWVAHNRLQGGDVGASDPHVAAAVVNGVLDGNMPVSEILRHAGDGLTAADTQMLAAAATRKDPATKAAMGVVAGAINDARDTLAAPENGLAGQAAYSRFVNWILSAARMSPPEAFNANDPGYLLAGNKMHQFAPTPADAVAAIPRSADRPSLSEIFKG